MPGMDRPFAFRDWVRAQKQPYSIFAAKAEIEPLAAAIAQIFQIASHQSDLPCTGKLSDLQGIPIVKFKNNPWSVVYWSIGRPTLLRTDCSRLAKKLTTQVINLMEKDTSGWLEWFFHDEENELEFADRMHNDEVYFESSLRPRLNFAKLNKDVSALRPALDRAIDELFSEQQLYIPSLDLDLTDPAIERIDLLKTPEFPLGGQEFRHWIYQGHPEYSIFVVKAPIATVAQTLLDKKFAKNWQAQVQTDGTLLDLLSKSDGYSMPLVQPTANPWTVIYWAVGGWIDISGIAKDFSSVLQTKVITWGEEDTSGAFGYTIYEQGKEIEYLEYCPGEELVFSSEVREEPEFDNFDDADWEVVNHFINQTFIQEGVYFPSFDLRVADPYLERVDLVVRSR